MKIKVTHENGIARFAISGDIDEIGSETLERQFHELDKNAVKELIMDLGDVHYIGSSAIGQLLLFYKEISLSGGVMRIEKVSKELYALLLDLDINKLIQISR